MFGSHGGVNSSGITVFAKSRHCKTWDMCNAGCEFLRNYKCLRNQNTVKPGAVAMLAVNSSGVTVVGDERGVSIRQGPPKVIVL